MSKSIYMLTAAVAAAAILSGCGKPAAENKPLVMITESGFPPYEYLEGEKIVGVDVEICSAIAAKLGRELKVEDAKFDAVIPSVLAGKADFGAAGITVTEDRKQSVDFSVPYVTSGIVIVSPKATPYKDVESIKGKRIGVQSGTTSDNFCVETVGQEPERFDAPPSAAAALKAGKLDLIIVDIDPAKNVIKGEDDLAITSDFLSKEEFAIAIRKGQPELLAAMNEVIEELVKSGKVEAWKAEHDKRYAAVKGVEETVAPAAEEVKEAVEAVAEKAEVAVETTAAKADEAAAAVAEEVKGTAAAAEEKAGEVVSAVAEKAEVVVEAAAAKADEAAAAAVEEVKEAAAAAVEEVKETAAAAEEKAGEVVSAVAEKAEVAVEAAAAAVEEVKAAVAPAAEK